MPAALVASVEGLRIARMDLHDEPGEGIRQPRHGDEMDVIVHPAPTEEVDGTGGELGSQEVLVAAPVFVGQEDLLAIIAAMGDVMRDVDRDHPRLAGHEFGGMVSRPTIRRDKWALSPFFSKQWGVYQIGARLGLG